MSALCAEHGFTQFLSWASALRGCALAEQGRDEEGIAQTQEGLDVHYASGASLNRPLLLVLLAEVCRKRGRVDLGLSALSEGLAAADQHENRVCEAEIHRLKGELLLKKNTANAAEAEGCFRVAIETARRQSANRGSCARQ